MNRLTPGGAVPLAVPLAWLNIAVSDLLTGQSLAGSVGEWFVSSFASQRYEMGDPR